MTPDQDASGIPTGIDPHPVVRLPRQGLPGAAIAGGAILLAIILFLVLNGRRHNALVSPDTTAYGAVFASPPPLATPAAIETAAEPPPTRIVTTRASTLPPGRGERWSALPLTPPIIVPSEPQPFRPSVTPSEDISAPISNGEPKSALVYDLGNESRASGTSTTSPAVGAASGAVASVSGDDTAAQATTMRNRTDVVPIGTMVPIVLETPIDTARPGLVRAIASRDTRGFDGRRILIPRGSRFIGDYQADIRSGQNRVLVTWTRVIRPDGVTVRLGSPAADQLGGSGIPGKVNSFFLQRFAGAVLQSALTVGVGLASRPRAGSVIVGIPSTPITTIGQGLISNDYRPKITVKQGEALNVFVARDLDFSGFPAGQR